MRRNDRFLLRRLGRQDILVPLGSQVADMNGVVILNTTGRCVWELLAEDRSADDLVAAIAEEFDVDRERVQTDVQAFLDQVTHMGLLET